MDEGSAPAPPETPRAERSKQAKIIDYALLGAVKRQQITQAQSETISSLFDEAEASTLGESLETKMAKFEKLIRSRFGPKAGTIWETVLERRKEIIAHLQERSLKRENGEVSATNSQDSLPRSQPQQQQQQQQHQQMMPSQGFQALSGGPHLSGPQHQQQPHPSMNYMAPSPPTVGGMHQQPQQQQQPQTHWQMQNTQSYYPLNQAHHNNSNNSVDQGSGMMYAGGNGGGNNGGGGMGTFNPPGPSNSMFNNNNLLLQSMQAHGMFNHQQPSQHHQNQQSHQQQQRQQMTAQQQAQLAQKQLMQKKMAQQVQQHKQQQQLQQQQQQQQQQHLQNQHSSGGGGLHSQQQHMQHSSGPAALTPQEEIERETERVRDLQSEGLELTSDRGLSASLITGDFVRDEKTLQRSAVRNAMGEHTVGSSVSAYGVRHVSQNQMVDLTGSGSYGGGDLPPRDLEPGQEWQVQNVLDLPVVTALCRRILGEDRKMSPEAQTVLSQGIQQYVKNLMESSIKNSKSRTNRASLNSYDGLTKMIIEHGKGYVLPENQQNVAMKWGPDISAILRREEMEARKIVRDFNIREEDSLREEMRLYDEERGKLQQASSSKRKFEVDAPWWIQDDIAEKAGTLSFEELSNVHFKLKVAQKYSLGVHQPALKKKLTKAARDEQAVREQQMQQYQQMRDQQAQQREEQERAEQAAAAAAAASSSSAAATAATGEEQNHASSATSVINWANQPCPLRQVPRNMITVDDIEHTINHTSFARSAVAGIGCNLSRDREGVGRHVQRWRLGLDLHQLIEK